MLDPKRFRQEEGSVRAALISRNFDMSVLDKYIELDKTWREKRQLVDAHINERKQLMPKGKPHPEALASLKIMSGVIKQGEEDLQTITGELKELAMGIPNTPMNDVPIGKNEDENVEIRKEGAIRLFSFPAKSHEDVGVNAGVLDFDSAAKITGSRFVVYKGLGAKLERALSSFMLDVHTSEHGYEEILPPVIVNSDSLRGTGQLPKFADDCFSLGDTDYFLSPTAEVQLTNLYRDTIVDEADLPLQLTAHTACFRKEAGSYGRDVKGIIRQHQFNKVELVHLLRPEDSEAALDRLVSHAENILKKLELPYKVLKLCTGDIGFSSAKTYDLEVWFPSQNQYREISSCSTFLDFQARRAMIRYRETVSGHVNYLHTLNGSGLAVGRTVAALLENYQNEDGSIDIPTVLRPYMGVEKITC